jgi:hypothetical protein
MPKFQLKLGLQLIFKIDGEKFSGPEVRLIVYFG